MYRPWGVNEHANLDASAQAAYGKAYLSKTCGWVRPRHMTPIAAYFIMLSVVTCPSSTQLEGDLRRGQPKAPTQWWCWRRVDPLYYGIGAWFNAYFWHRKPDVLSENVSSIQVACHRFRVVLTRREMWSALHGRPLSEFAPSFEVRTAL